MLKIDDMNEDQKKVVDIFRSQLPETFRILNPPRVTEEAIFGFDCPVPDDDELPEQKVYEHWESVMDELVKEGVLQTGDFHGETVYGFTTEFCEQELNMKSEEGSDEQAS